MDQELQQYNKSTYNVLLCSTPLSLPFSLMGSHLYFVIIDHDEVSRYEVLYRLYPGHDSYGYIFKDARKPLKGLGLLYPGYTGKRLCWNSEVLESVSGGWGSSAHKLTKVIRDTTENYPHRDHYRLIPGPNSNTYVGWCINQVEGIDWELPRLAIGTGFRDKHNKSC